MVGRRQKAAWSRKVEGSGVSSVLPQPDPTLTHPPLPSNLPCPKLALRQPALRLHLDDVEVWLCGDAVDLGQCEHADGARVKRHQSLQKLGVLLALCSTKYATQVGA